MAGLGESAAVAVVGGQRHPAHTTAGAALSLAVYRGQVAAVEASLAAAGGAAAGAGGLLCGLPELVACAGAEWSGRLCPAVRNRPMMTGCWPFCRTHTSLSFLS